jgi:signal transduction histidine kinase/phage shock protein PspC (stress-responsive transcriptional regulator)
VTSTAAPGTQTPESPPLLDVPRTRRSADRILLGVAGGFAQRWRVDPTLLRAAIALLSLAGGVGVALYGVGVLLSEPRPTATSEPAPPVTAPERRRNIAVVVATCAVLLAARELSLWPGDDVMIAAGIVAVAVTVLWSPARSDARGGRIRGLALAPAVRLVLGAILAIAGIAALTGRTDGLNDVGRSVSAIAIALGGIAVIAAPALGRLLDRLDTERTLRIREEERATLAEHLHDSVLQSLVLIQRSDDPRRMVSLARRQERELRSWLYGGQPAGQPASLTAAVEMMAMAIEVDHEVRVEVVTVGDAPLDDAETTFLAALREATMNAVRHSDADKVDVYVEVGDEILTGFVRDTGVGFDPAGVPDDRHGIADSIIARIERAGGRATVTSRPGEGTEVEVELPWRRTLRNGPTR